MCSYDGHICLMCLFSLDCYLFAPHGISLSLFSGVLLLSETLSMLYIKFKFTLEIEVFFTLIIQNWQEQEIIGITKAKCQDYFLEILHDPSNPSLTFLDLLLVNLLVWYLLTIFNYIIPVWTNIYFWFCDTLFHVHNYFINTYN